MCAEICKKEILSTQLGISAAVEGCLLENLLFKRDVYRVSNIVSTWFGGEGNARDALLSILIVPA